MSDKNPKYMEVDLRPWWRKPFTWIFAASLFLLLGLLIGRKLGWFTSGDETPQPAPIPIVTCYTPAITPSPTPTATPVPLCYEPVPPKPNSSSKSLKDKHQYDLIKKFSENGTITPETTEKLRTTPR